MRPERFDEVTKILTRKGSRRRGLGLIAGGALSTLLSRKSTTAADDKVVVVDIQILTKDQIAGVLTVDGRELGFALRSGELLPTLAVTAASGQEWLAIEPVGGQIVTRIANGQLVTSIPWVEAQAVLVNRPIVSGDSEAAADIATVVIASDDPGTPDGESPLPSNDVVAVFGDFAQVVTVEGSMAAVDEFRASEAYELLPELSLALGSAGLTGVSYPPSLALHALGLAAATDLGTAPEEPGVTYRVKLPGQLERPLTAFDLIKLYEDGILDCMPPGYDDDVDGTIYSGCGGGGEPCESHPNRDDGCYGMCGWGCNCRREICGDCCYHDFCAAHDDLMRHCSGTLHPVTRVTATIGAPLSFITYGGCDGWWGWDWPW